ncbi:glycosyltransferase family 2 protein [Halobacteriovorax sp.]|uniref:glycosyltransferase family 2 protein n=1 Tax=Halobacteriovorax sp. TaxID=2020862 RepID=UPI003AF2C4EA
MKLISIVVPVFNEEGNIDKIFKEISKHIPNKYNYEIIFVNDGSSDKTLDIVKELSHNNSKAKYISLSRNFGHQYALKAGLDNSYGDAVISLDGDLQHPPSLIPELLKEWENGAEVVGTQRVDNDDSSLFKTLSSKWFYRIFTFLSELDLPEGAADFRLLDKSVVDTIRTLKESNLFIRGLVQWMGYKQVYVKYSAKKRNTGVSKYSLMKMIRFSLSGLTSFSIRPLHLSSVFGLCTSFIGFIYGVYAIFSHIYLGQTVDGWTSIVASILFIGGIQLLSMGIFGEYLGKMFIESKRRPIYIISESSDAKK